MSSMLIKSNKKKNNNNTHTQYVSWKKINIFRIDHIISLI